jgi:mannose-6-phosphate isomerase-like protein (cupin superfamily)
LDTHDEVNELSPLVPSTTFEKQISEEVNSPTEVETPQLVTKETRSRRSLLESSPSPSPSPPQKTTKKRQPLKTITNNADTKKQSAKTKQKISPSPPTTQKVSNQKEKENKQKQSGIKRKGAKTPISTRQSDVDTGPRRSKRTRLQADEIPIYDKQTIKDFEGHLIKIDVVVGTKKCEPLFPQINAKKTTKKVAAVRKQVAASNVKTVREYKAPTAEKTQYALYYERLVRKLERAQHRIVKAERRRLRAERRAAEASTTAATVVAQTVTNDALNLDTIEDNVDNNEEEEVGEDESIGSIISSSDVNESRESFLLTSAKGEQTRQQTVVFSSKLSSKTYETITEGVKMAAMTDDSGVIVIEPQSSSKTFRHDRVAMYICQKGECIISLNGELIRLKQADTITIPFRVPYKFKNTLANRKTYLQFVFLNK